MIATTRVLEIPELVQKIQNYADATFEENSSICHLLLKYIHKVGSPSYNMRATCLAINSAIKMPQLENAKPFLNGTKCLLNNGYEQTKLELSFRLSAGDYAIAEGFGTLQDFSSDGTIVNPNFQHWGIITQFRIKKIDELEEHIKQHNNDVKRAFYLGIIHEDTQSLDIILKKNIPLIWEQSERYNFYKDLVLYAIDKKSHKSFEYLIQTNPFNLNNYFGYEPMPGVPPNYGYTISVGPITSTIMMECFRKGIKEEDQLLAFCKKNGCLPGEECLKRHETWKKVGDCEAPKSNKDKNHFWCNLL